ncbi:hypothetical protein JCM8547_006684 [Rhodosporidiobolus lusitaniae]
MPAPSLLSAVVKTRWARIRGKGAIRLEERESLPWVLNGKEADDEGYTSSHLLLECVLASTWNAFCLTYLVVCPRLDPLTGETLSPSPTFTYLLLALISAPLCIGVSAGSAALWGESKVDVDKREKSGWAKKTAMWFGMLVCIAAVWPMLCYVLQDQNPWLQRHLFVTLAAVQGLLIKAGCETFDDEDDENEETALTPPPAYTDADEKELLTVREMLLEAHHARQQNDGEWNEKREMAEARRYEEVNVVVTPPEEEERLKIHSFAV